MEIVSLEEHVDVYLAESALTCRHCLQRNALFLLDSIDGSKAARKDRVGEISGAA
jgi:hypothetical protein